jgi:hypothetical protein
MMQEVYDALETRDVVIGAGGCEPGDAVDICGRSGAETGQELGDSGGQEPFIPQGLKPLLLLTKPLAMPGINPRPTSSEAFIGAR